MTTTTIKYYSRNINRNN